MDQLLLRTISDSDGRGRYNDFGDASVGTMPESVYSSSFTSVEFARHFRNLISSPAAEEMPCLISWSGAESDMAAISSYMGDFLSIDNVEYEAAKAMLLNQSHTMWVRVSQRSSLEDNFEYTVTELSKRGSPLSLFYNQARWSATHAELDRVALLRDIWEDDDGSPPTDETVKSAKVVVEMLEGLNIKCQPAVSLAGDGEITLAWEKESEIATLSFLDNGLILGYAFTHASAIPWTISTDTLVLADLTPLHAIIACW